LSEKEQRTCFFFGFGAERFEESLEGLAIGRVKYLQLKNKFCYKDPMEKGFNSDISISGIGYHVQTEDWGLDNPFVVTRIFRSGAVVKSIKTPYSEIWNKAKRSDQHAIRLGMQLQHQEILDQLMDGQSR
jgi:hypothetical protein